LGRKTSPPTPVSATMPTTPAPKAGPGPDPTAAGRAMAGAFDNVAPIYRAAAVHPFDNVQPNLSVRDEFSRSDYNQFRPGERGGVLEELRRAYLDVPVIHNTVNLMSDFTIQGMDLVHPNPEVEKFYKEWWKKVRGKERSERIVNTALRMGTAIVVREKAKLKRKQERDLKRGLAAPQAPVEVTAREIPWRYTVLSPLSVEPVAPELDTFLNGSPGLYAVRMPEEVANIIKKPRNAAEAELVKNLPEEVVKAARTGGNKAKSVPIPRDKVSVVHFKKDDGEPWGTSILFPIRGAAALYRKAVLADMSALDGAVSQIRLWKVGDLEHQVFHTPADVARLQELLASNTAGGVMDLIWRPDIELVETKNEGWRFLTSDKYKQVMADIYAGLGVPPTLTGTGEGGGTTNNLVSIKTVVERLEYARMLLEEFWREELRQVQAAMGFRFAATLVYDRMALSDEAAELALLIQLADRDILSVEYIQERFGAIPEIEQVRLRRETRMRKRKLVPPKAGPWHDPEKDHKKELAFIGRGMLAPNQAGMDVPAPDKTKVYNPPEPKGGAATPSTKSKGRSGQGRPRNAKDGKKRKKKRFVPAGAALAAAVAGADEAQRLIADWAQPPYLAHVGKGNLRQLTDTEAAQFEDLKFDLLFALGGLPATPENLGSALAAVVNGEGAGNEARQAVAAAARQYERASGKPTLDRLRGIRAAVYASVVVANAA
jgi:hypothetical protein